ncbi:AraC family transcriptional regulator [Thalassotalea sp. 1_MG-2023]|uniref:helix-turn-helix domain-containing protein n=1 Tax=Thalassotalea sp. 1_MG-2023 TaxID=3062680 RepID=UPI0026E37AA1|nr:AraC family transcriptional regulator [Thalassotalea sp. 1_MG-2023]MDO6428532.1 AraC family transcriptional regulator [Thalassotalea sp. 1_MG-2023]
MTKHIQKSNAVYSVKHLNIPAQAGVEFYQHPQSQFLFITSGVLAVITKSGRYIIPACHGILIPANIRHELLAKTDVTLTTVYITDETFEATINQPFVAHASTFFKALMDELLAIPSPDKQTHVHHRLIHVFQDYLPQLIKRDTFLPYPQDERLIAIIEKLQKYPSMKSDLLSWGKFVQTSARTLTRNFKKETGLTYSQWRQRLNIQVAIKHLAQKDEIASIAALLGYQSSSSFIYMFRQQVGISPKQFLKSLT